VRSGGPLLCSFLCCALSSVVVVNRFFAVHLFLSLPWSVSFPCVFLRAYDKEIFAVRAHMTKIACTTTPIFLVVMCLISFRMIGILRSVEFFLLCSTMFCRLFLSGQNLCYNYFIFRVS
jgi:hypothetical protein